MTQAEKLKALVRRAVACGWDGIADSTPDRLLFYQVGETDVFARSAEQIIFNHDFARALFGEQEFQGLDAVIASEDAFTGVKRTHYWQCHLQQAVISNDPIDYMHKAVFGDE